MNSKVKRFSFGLDVRLSLFRHFFFWLPFGCGVVIAFLYGYTNNEVTSLASFDFNNSFKALAMPFAIIVGSISFSFVFERLFSHQQKKTTDELNLLKKFRQEAQEEFINFVDSPDIFSKYTQVELKKPLVLFGALYSFKIQNGSLAYVLNDDYEYVVIRIFKYAYKQLRLASRHPKFSETISPYAASHSMLSFVGVEIASMDQLIAAKEKGWLFESAVTYISLETLEHYILLAVQFSNSELAIEKIEKQLHFYTRVWMNSPFRDLLLIEELTGNPLHNIESDFSGNPNVITWDLTKE